MSSITHNCISMFSLTLKDLNDADLARAVMKLILSYGTEFKPSHYDEFTPVKKKFRSDSLEEGVQLWLNKENNIAFSKDKFLRGQLMMEKMTGSKINYTIRWEKSNRKHYNGFHINVNLDHVMKNKNILVLSDFLKKLGALIEPLYCSVYNASIPGWSNPIDLKKRLPELQWMTFYGEPYIKMFGREKLLSAPAYKVEEISSKLIAIQLTEDVFHPVPEDVRKKFKDFLGTKAFVEDVKLPSFYEDGLVPELDFSNVLFDKIRTAASEKITG